MKSAFKSLYGFAAIAMLLLAAMPAIFAGLPASIPPPDDIAMWIQPVYTNLTTATVDVGYKFNVTVWGKSNVYTSAWQFWMRYNGLILNATGAWYCLPNGMGSKTGPSEWMQGVTTSPVSPGFKNIGTVNARVEYTEAFGGGDVYASPHPTGARMAIVEFQVMAVPGKGETLESLIEISWEPTKTWILDQDGVTYYRKSYDAYYKLEWAAPPGPGLVVSPTTRFFDRYSIQNGTTFTETVKLTNLAAAWYLTNVSFTLTFNPDELELIDISKNNAAWNVALNVDNTTTAGQVVTYAETSQALSGDVDIISLTFMIIDQEIFPTVENHVLGLTGVSAFDHTLQIPVSPITPATITVEGYLAVAMPWMEVKPKDTVLGPDFVKHTRFQVEVTINRLHFAWKLVAVEFRLSYDKTLLKVISVEEGPYLKDPTWAPYGTWFIVYIEDDGHYGPHVLVGDIIKPNGTGYYGPPFPGDQEGGAKENGTIAIITFEVLEQLPGYNGGAADLTSALDLFKIRMIDVEPSLIPVDTDRVVNGTVTIKGFVQQGRFIDVYGGADNAGYGLIPFPAPYGGQGKDQPMDLVIPQSEVTLFADVTYNYWPVQSKDVNFEVEGPYDHANGQYIPKQNKFVLLKETARTNASGVATISFAMPWYCVNPESLLGVWKVTATVNIRDEVVMDTLYFYYDYMVHIWKVTANETYYAHCETVEITVEYGSHAMRTYPGLFSAVIKDELNVVIGMALANVTLGGAQFCTFANGTVTLSIHIEKWAFVGYADIYVNCYDKDPTIGGFAWTPQDFEDDKIYILPN